MDLEHIFIITEINMREIGKMICNMVKELKFGLMVLDMKDNT